MQKGLKLDNRDLYIKDTDIIEFVQHYNDEQKKTIVDMVLERFRRSQNWRDQFRRNWIENEELYLAISPYYEGRPEWQSNYFDPQIFKIVETILPRLLGALFDTPPICTVSALSPEAMQQAQYVEGIIQREVEKMKYYGTCADTFKELLIHGTGIQKSQYIIGDNYDGCAMQHISIFDFFPQPNKQYIEGMQWCIQRTVQHISDIIDEGEDLYDKEALLKLKDGSSGGVNYLNGFDRSRFIGSQSDDSCGGYHEILEMWGKAKDPKTGKNYNMIVTVGDRAHILRCEENPFYISDGSDKMCYSMKPYHKFIDMNLPGQFYGLGECDVLKSTQRKINDMTNMVMDSYNYLVSPSFEINAAALEDEDDIDNIILAPGEAIRTQPGMGSVVNPVKKDTSGVMIGFQAMDRHKSKIQEISGIHDVITGEEGTIRQTATESIYRTQEANMRIRSKNQYNMFGGMSDAFRSIYYMVRQFAPPENIIKLYSNYQAIGWETISVDMLKGNFDFSIQPSTLYGTKSIIAQTRMRFAEIVASNPEFQKQINPRVMLMGIANSLDINGDKLFLSPEEQQQAMMQQQMMAQAMQQPQQPQQADMGILEQLGQLQGGGMPQAMDEQQFNAMREQAKQMIVQSPELMQAFGINYAQ